jgi:CheY-like chemotaxis protein
MKKILVIDDDPSIFIALKEILQKFYELEQARDGAEGLVKVKASKPDLIFLDILMPTLNGFEVLDELKSRSAFKSIPVIIFSILEDEKDKEEAFSKGAVAFFSKADFDPHDIIEKIREVLKA